MQDDVPATVECPVAEEQAEKREAAEWLCCRVCSERIALMSAAVSFDGDHRHRFSNPHGFEFQIALYAEAPGCRDQGEPTEYFSWFPGFAWRVAVCSGCHTHLGWSFHCIGPPGPGEPDGFHALISDRLRPESSAA